MELSAASEAVAAASEDELGFHYGYSSVPSAIGSVTIIPGRAGLRLNLGRDRAWTRVRQVGNFSCNISQVSKKLSKQDKQYFIL